MPPEHDINAIHERVTTLEHWRIQRDIADARAEEQRKYLDQRFDALDGKVGKINESLTWIARMVLGAILLAFVAFLLRGGLNLPSP